MDPIIILLVIVITLFVIWLRTQLYTVSDTGLPPGSMGLPFIGETIEFARKKVEFFREKHNQYGRIFKTGLFGKSIIRVYGSENIRRIIQGENKIVRSSYPTSVRKLIGDQSISMSHDDTHKTKKQELMKYLSPEFFHNHTPILAEAIAHRVEEWCERPDIDLYHECRKLFLELAAKFLINVDIGQDDVAALQDNLEIFTANIFCLPVNLPGFGFYKALKAKKEMRKIIAAALHKSANNNLIPDELCSVLQGFQQSNDTDLKHDDILLDSIIDLLFSGGQTVNSAAFSLAHNLCKRPDVRERLLEDIENRGLMNRDEPVCARDLTEMTYVDAVVKETLRLLPPVGGAYRTAIETFQLDGYTVPKGWSVVFSIRETHMHDADIADPTLFNPDQWLHTHLGKDKYSYLPFGRGPRLCPGQAYANMILRLFAVEFTRNCSGTISKDCDLDLWPTPRPTGQVLATLSRIKTAPQHTAY